MSDEPLSETAADLAGALLAAAGSRVTATLEEIGAALDDVAPLYAAAPERRRRLGELIAELAAAGVVGPSKRLDRREAPALPAFVTLAGPPRARRAVPEAARFPWRPELAWAAGAGLSAREFADLRAISEFLRHGGAARPVVPVQERSLELFGHEKAHERLRDGRLWRDGRLSDALLRTRRAAAPFPYRVVGPGAWLLVAENEATFDSLAATAPAASPVGVVGWGAGGLFRKTVAWAAELGATIDRPAFPAAIRYFGDLDGDGLRIPAAASALATRSGLPAVRPAVGLYRRLLAAGRPEPTEPLDPALAADLASWLGPALAPAAADLLAGGHRLAQEAVGLEALGADRSWACETELTA